jgi:hypothetical protein
VPDPDPYRVWYGQEIIYGEVYSEGDIRAVAPEELFSDPFVYDQRRYTEALVNLTNNQLPITIDPNLVDVRLDSQMPSIAPSFAPSSMPSIATTSAPSPPPTAPRGRDTTTTVIIAVTVPAVVLLLVAFVGIIYVTRDQTHLLDTSEGFHEVTPLPTDQDAGTGPTEPAAMQPEGEQGPLFTGTETTVPLFREPDVTTTTVAGEHPDVVVTPGGRLSHLSNISEVTTPVDSDRRRLPGTPGVMSGTGTFTPSFSPQVSA